MAKQFSPGRRGPGGKRFQGQNSKERKNERIRVPEIRVIGPDGNQIGVMQTKEALTFAKKLGLDLVEISPTARPPVCRIMDYGKYQYEQSKKTKENKSATTKLKEVKFRLNIDQHDYMTKLRHAEVFLYKGNKLKITLMMRGREMEHKDLGFDIVKRAVVDLEHIGNADSDPRLAGRNISLTVSPLPSNRRKLKFNSDDEEEPEEEAGE